MALGIEGDAGNEGNVNKRIVGKGFSDGLHDAKGSLDKIVRACIATEFHRCLIDNLRQKDDLALCHKVVYKLMRTDFIGKGVIGKDDTGIGKSGSQTGDDGLRQSL